MSTKYLWARQPGNVGSHTAKIIQILKHGYLLAQDKYYDGFEKKVKVRNFSIEIRKVKLFISG